MDNNIFVKKFSFPSDFKAPLEFKYEDLIAKPLSRSDLIADMNAVNSSLELIRNTRGGTWPSEAVSEEFDFLDLAWHEREFRDGDSFAYVVYDKLNNYIGCVYLYPMGLRTKIDESNLNYEMDASWWVTKSAYNKGYYQKLFKALQIWLNEYPVKSIYYSNKEKPS